MKQIIKARIRVIFALSAVVCLALSARAAEAAYDSSEVFLSAEFGLSSARTQERMENSGAEAVDYMRGGQVTMKGLFEGRSAIFIFGFHSRRGLNHKSVYLASIGDADEDKAFYEACRAWYNTRFGTTEERVAQHRRVKGRLTYHNSWRPDKDTIISLSYDPEITERFPNDSPNNRPIHLIYNYSRWSN